MSGRKTYGLQADTPLVAVGKVEAMLRMVSKSDQEIMWNYSNSVKEMNLIAEEAKRCAAESADEDQKRLAARITCIAEQHNTVFLPYSLYQYQAISRLKINEKFLTFTRQALDLHLQRLQWLRDFQSTVAIYWDIRAVGRTNNFFGLDETDKAIGRTLNKIRDALSTLNHGLVWIFQYKSGDEMCAMLRCPKALTPEKFQRICINSFPEINKAIEADPVDLIRLRHRAHDELYQGREIDDNRVALTARFISGIARKPADLPGLLEKLANNIQGMKVIDQEIGFVKHRRASDRRSG